MPTAQITRVGPVETARSFGLHLYRQAYDQGINLSQLCERMDPTSELPEAERGLDAFERVLREAKVITSPVDEYGVQASTWEEATDTPEKRAMMHEFAARIWRQTTHGQPKTPLTRALLLSGDAALNTIANQYADAAGIRAKRLAPAIPIEELVGMTTRIRGDAYRSLYITDDLGSDAYRMKRVTEGADIPTTTLVTGEHTLRIHKFGRALRSTYDQLRRQRLDRIAFIIARMALQAEVDKAEIVVSTIVNGDGNANTAAEVLALTALDPAAVAGTLTLRGWLAFKLEFGQAYQPDVVLGQRASILDLLLLPVLTNTNQLPIAMLAAGPFGQVRPIGDRLADGERYGITEDAPADNLVMFDPAQTVERVVEIGGNVSEVERFIQNQTTLFTMTEVEGYGIVDPYAARVLNVNG